MRNETTVSKWGNSLAVRIPQAIAKEARLSEGDCLLLDLDRGASSCARPGGGTNCRNWSPGSRPRIVIGKRTGDSRRVRNPGEHDVRTRDR
jgi:hypothetical protein